MHSVQIELDLRKTALENAREYYEKSKSAKSKLAGAQAAIKETEKKIASHLNRKKFEKKPEVRVKVARLREWFEKYHHFTTSGNDLVVAGRDAKSNDLLAARHMEKDDLFFHADVHGASAVILKGGQSASEQSKKEAAQFAACYSSAWKAGQAVATVFAATPEQVKKYSPGEYVAKGGFMIYGKKDYYRGVQLKLWLVKKEDRVFVVPECFDFAGAHGIQKLLVSPGQTAKSDAAKKLTARLGLEPAMLDFLIQELPGSIYIEKE
ncbi:MAG: NFACT RNA binding domain-containing protein [Candidatus Micrarchaeota archaeon]